MTSHPSTVLVAGGGGFIGGHVAAHYLRAGYRVVCADKKPLDQWYQVHSGALNRVLDLSRREAAFDATAGADLVINLAADMGGMGFIENHKALCMLSVLINTHLLEAAVEHGVGTYFYASSACVYNGTLQDTPEVRALREEDAYPALPEDGYGWEKLFSERMCRHFHEDFGLDVRVARFHNVYGPHGTYDGGREKAPAAVCRKVIEACLTGSGEIEIWGDGSQTRSFMYVDDCVEGIQRLIESGDAEPINLGSHELVTINQLVDVVEALAELELERVYLPDAPTGVRGRNSDNSRILDLLGWEPRLPLAEGMARTYDWILGQITQAASAAGTQRQSEDGRPACASAS